MISSCPNSKVSGSLPSDESITAPESSRRD
jgi:hypothetical protein